MEPKKVYETVAVLLDNIIKNEKLRYFLIKNSAFKDKFINQVNNLLTLEKSYNEKYKDIEWAKTFAKGIVKLTKQKQRFEKKENITAEAIYAEYSEFLIYLTDNFEVERHTLIDSSINFTEEDIIFNSKLSKEDILRFDELEDAKKPEPEAINSQQSEKINPDNIYVNPGIGGINNGMGGAGFNPNQFMNEMPIHPMQNPKFYPYDRKIKRMPLFKIILASTATLAAVLLIIAQIILLNVKANIDVDALNKMFPGWENLFWNNKGNTVIKFDPTAIGITGTTITVFNIISSFIYTVPVIYLWLDVARNNPAMRLKYRMSMFNGFFIIIFTVFVILAVYQFISLSGFEKSWTNVFNSFYKKTENPKNPYEWYNPVANDVDVDGIVQMIMNKNGDMMKAISGIMISALIISSAALLFAITLLMINPKMDRQKIAKANMEYQKAAMSAMQGQKYEMDPSLFENEETENSKSEEESEE